ncbi:hypothetical protein C9374_012423 [Naegleria lovaniensis]|uniref:Uncharacterized protein n=1 Tax=Naegleria lovaniensis TaxID=51637 RepID=A0AA88KCD9_NAELO|nr:uncharacterized protein C9374_012321 [Naegleria lovaniensis]XP_044554065.1 uncharacterized protein C9374_012423 [Naegleria lovaniensis]KAG2373218.1 hypothetical protein C9374_012321 [Naegleria lovaniensis]KAG2392171.1 hypothetical protein C9374_012423 [Naegleria lovaniensis]
MPTDTVRGIKKKRNRKNISYIAPSLNITLFQESKQFLTQNNASIKQCCKLKFHSFLSQICSNPQTQEQKLQLSDTVVTHVKTFCSSLPNYSILSDCDKSQVDEILIKICRKHISQIFVNAKKKAKLRRRSGVSKSKNSDNLFDFENDEDVYDINSEEYKLYQEHLRKSSSAKMRRSRPVNPANVVEL